MSYFLLLWIFIIAIIFEIISIVKYLLVDRYIKKKVILLGLSGNPPTGDSGHRGIVRAIEKLYSYDEIWILPVYQHTFNSKRNLLPFEIRMRLCELNFGDFKNCKVLPIERDLFLYHKNISGEEKPIGTIDLLKYLNNQYNKFDFTFCLGGDTFNDLISGKWNDDDELIKTTNLLVINRQGYEINNEILQKKNTKSLRILTINTLDEVSSTLIKKSLNDDNEYAMEKLYPLVYYYIKRNNLYKLN